MLWYRACSQHGEEGTPDVVEGLVAQPAHGGQERHWSRERPWLLDGRVFAQLMWRAHLRVSPNPRIQSAYLLPVQSSGWWGSEGVVTSNVPTVGTEQDAGHSEQLSCYCKVACSWLQSSLQYLVQYYINACACLAIALDIFHVKAPYQRLSESRLHRLTTYLSFFLRLVRYTPEECMTSQSLKLNDKSHTTSLSQFLVDATTTPLRSGVTPKARMDVSGKR